MWNKLLKTDGRQGATIPLRIALAAIFLGHGSQKLFGLLGGKGLTATAELFADKLGLIPGILWAVLAGLGEFGGGLLLLLGFCTRFGALLIAIVMAVAMIKVHWGTFFLPTGIEYTFSLFCAALALMIMGGGKFSLDAQLQKDRPGNGRY